MDSTYNPIVAYYDVNLADVYISRYSMDLNTI
jgi:hypothetical protein